GKAKGIVLPGVGAFNDAIAHLKKFSLDEILRKEVEKGKALLGICLGMQLLFERSYEDGLYEGLGLLKGEVVRFEEGVKIPHMGWNSLHPAKEHPIAKGVAEGEYVYFVHSYHLSPSYFDDVVLYTDYGGKKIPAVVARDRIIGMQFHPEKSSITGQKLLQNFKEMVT
ncbi:MAG TPA: imidazole glycerol phosphate synthase subunit HisH, partial [Eubacteriaceae bacterium]|nr:imidazole glycerol phosphate synthase subunit HisH [Eubacteriaceae bacterium]